MQGLDLAAYRSRVESILRELFEGSDALHKIKSGLPVAAAELDSLVSDVLVRDPDLNLEDLLVHFPNKSKNLALAIRQIIGMDAERVDEHFKTFVRKYPTLNANQIRFLEMLKGYVARFGVIELEQLWDTPFTSLHTQGVDGVFTQTEQVDDLLDLLKELNEPAA
jgi:type I restriction enzyme R subunit